MSDVIVTDGLWRKSLSAVRSLGKSGHNVTVFGDTLFTTAFWSRYTKNRVICPDAKYYPQKFGEKLLSYLNQGGWDKKPILLPMEDDTLNWVSEHRNKLEGIVDFLIPENESLAIAQDKSATLKLAKQIGLPVPQTYTPSTIDEFLKIIDKLVNKDELDGYIVKPICGSGSSGLIYLNKGLAIDWNEHWLKYGKLIIQEKISSSGTGLGVSVLCDSKQNPVATFAHARLQQYPNTGGPSTSRISIKDDLLVDMSIRLLKELHWTGVAMVEWKMDPKTNTPVLMEINPRFWGSLELAIRSGVDFPKLYVEAVRNNTIDYDGKYIVGIVCRWLFPGEILRYVTQKTIDREGLLDFFKGLPRMAEEWDSNDLRGFFSAFFCPAISVLNPKYWKYLRR